MSRFKILATLIVAVAVLTTPLSAVPAATVWKLPTAVPTGSLWHKGLTDMTSAWAKDTAGRLTATVFPNSALGGEPAVVRNMRSNQFQASLLMLSGLALIDEGFNALGIPFFFKDDAETRAVQEALTPELEKRLNAKGFHLLAWTNGGWVQLYSKTQMKTLDDIKKAKLWTSDGDTRMVQWYKTNGFHPVASDAKDVVPQMRTGAIDATPSPSYIAQVTSLYREAQNMLDVHVGPLLGALVVTNEAWKAVSPEDQAKIAAAAKVFEKTTSSSVPAQDAGAIVEMQKRGLTVTKMAPKDEADLYAQIAKLVASMRGDMVPADMYDQAKKAVDAYRAKSTAPAKR